jgi:murein DD-endopeptidase MepM/ murein hydrolase activator NlpD
VLVRVSPAEGGLPTGLLAGRPLRFFAHGGEAWAIGALPVETAPGTVPVEVTPAAGAAARAALEVVEPGFRSKRLTLAAKYVEPPPKAKARMALDRKAFTEAYDRPVTPLAFSGRLAWPRPEDRHGRFGDQRIVNGVKKSVHYGVDIDAPRGAPVHAAADGEVVLARDCYMSGKTVVVWHGADLFTLYFHLDRMAVKAGDRVREGDTVGVVGSTGRSTGPHLHWSVRAAGLQVDPESLVAIDFAAGAAPPRRPGSPDATPDAKDRNAAEPRPEPAQAPAAAPSR